METGKLAAVLLCVGGVPSSEVMGTGRCSGLQDGRVAAQEMTLPVGPGL